MTAPDPVDQDDEDAQRLRVEVDRWNELVHLHRDGGEVFSLSFVDVQQLVSELTGDVVDEVEANTHSLLAALDRRR